MGKRLVRLLGGIGLAGLLLALTVAPVAAAAMVARVVGSGIQFDGSGFYPGELVQVTGVRYDGSTLPFGTAMANPVGAITGIVPYADTALSQIDARGYASGMHAVSNITGALPYPVVPPGYPYVGPTYPYYTVVVPGALPTNGGYANTGYPYTGAPYGGFSPGPGFNYPVPSSGAILSPYPVGYPGVVGVPTFVSTVPYAVAGAPVIFTGTGWTPGAQVALWATAPNGTNQSLAPVTVGVDGSITDTISFGSPGAWLLSAQMQGMSQPISAVVQVN